MEHWPIGLLQLYLRRYLLKRDLNIVLIDATNPFGSGFLLPAGSLREPLWALRRADIFVITHADLTDDKRMEFLEARLNSYRKKIVKITCNKCGSKLNLGIHHKDFDHYNNNETNLQVLCVHCHLSLHKTEYWDAVRNGRKPKKSTAPCRWKKQ